MAKVYTAQNMRETAKLYDARAKTTMEVCSRRGGAAMVTVFPSQGISDHEVSAMLRQAADAMEREAAKDTEIARLRECLREATEWSCGNPDENCEDCVAHGGDTPCKCEKWRKALGDRGR